MCCVCERENLVVEDICGCVGRQKYTHHARAVEHGVGDGADGGAVLEGVAAGDDEEVERLELGGEGEEAAGADLCVTYVHGRNTYCVVEPTAAVAKEEEEETNR